MGITPFRFSEGNGDLAALSGMIPDLCCTGILSTKVRLRFNSAIDSSGDEEKTLNRGRTDLTAKPCIVNAKLINFWTKL
jgi:hypothetical protein